VPRKGCRQGGRLRRNFQGYTDDQSPVLIGLGASAISQFPDGYVQNATATFRSGVSRLTMARPECQTTSGPVGCNRTTGCGVAHPNAEAATIVTSRMIRGTRWPFASAMPVRRHRRSRNLDCPAASA
jgi:hypothetical protein